MIEKALKQADFGIQFKDQIPIKLFLSGAISSLPLKEAMFNFEVLEHKYKEKGFEVINPLKIKGWREGLEWVEYMNLCLPELMRCQIISLQKNWGNSRGARIERAVALEMGIKLIHE